MACLRLAAILILLTDQESSTGLRPMGSEASVYDIAPAILHIYRVEPPKQTRGHVLDEIFETREQGRTKVKRVCITAALRIVSEGPYPAG